jgi:competence protein ComEC
LYADPLQARFKSLAERVIHSPLPSRLVDAIGEYFLFTLAAQITTLPLMIFHFQRLSLVGLIANPLILPPQPLVMVLGGIATLAGLVWLPLGQALAALAWPFVAYTNRGVELLARIPLAALPTGNISLVFILLFYALLFFWTLAPQRLKSIRSVFTPAVILLGLMALTALAWRGVLPRSDKRLRLTLLPGSSERVILIQTPEGHAILINGGASAVELEDALGQRLPLFSRRLDALALTSSTREGLGALDDGAMSLFPPNLVWWIDPGADAASVGSLRTLFDQLEIRQAFNGPGSVLELGSGATLTALGNEQGQTSAVELRYHNFSALLPLGATAGLPVRTGPVNILYLDERSLQNESISVWRSAVHPGVVIVSGAPTPAETDVISTQTQGWIEVASDGSQMWITAEKGNQ